MTRRVRAADFESLVAKARDGDREARSRVVEILRPVLVGFFRSRLSSADPVEDLVQNSLLRVLRGFDELNDARAMKAFAMKAALFELQDHYRGRYAMRESALDESMEIAADRAPEGLALDLDAALASLPEKARTILELKAMGYRYEEIAGMLGTTEAAVKMQVKRGIERLRAFLGVPAWVAWFLLRGIP